MYSFKDTKNMINQYKDFKFDYLIQDTFRPRTINLIAGDGGCGKTTFCLQLAKALSDGGVFFGKQCKRSNLLWINNEMSEDFWTSRLQSTGEANFKVISFNFTLGNDEDIKNFAEACKRAEIEVIIIDSLVASLVYTDENDNVKMGLLFKRLRQIFCVEYGITVFLIHHTGKAFAGSLLDIYRVRGASAIKDGCDTVLMMASYKDESRVAKIVKSRSGNKFSINIKMIDGKFVESNLKSNVNSVLTDQILLLLNSQKSMKQFEICNKINKSKSIILKCLNDYEGVLWIKTKISKAYEYKVINQDDIEDE